MNAPLPYSQIRTVTLHLKTRSGGSAPVEVLETPGMTLLSAIKQARGTLPPTWIDGFNCHSGACNTCSISINGKPGVPCNTFVRDLGRQVTVSPGSHDEGWENMRHSTTCSSH